MADVLHMMNGAHMMSTSSEDNECAQALLELAMSTFYAPPTSCSDATNVLRRPSPEEEERLEIVKRIKLDHCYYWVQGTAASQSYHSDFASTCSENSCDTDDVDISFHKYPPGIKSGKENALDVVAKLRVDRREKKVALKSNVLLNKFQNHLKDPFDFEDDATRSSVSSQGNECNEEEQNNSTANSGLDLLLKCLSDTQPWQSRSGPESSTSQEEDFQEDSETESEDETGFRRQPDVEYEHKCRHCMKTFSKKRYLTKHVRRMHPDGMITSPEEISTACPNCLKVVSKRNFQRHLIICQYDRVSCQLCGLHLHREHLAAHKEKMHGAQRSVDVDIVSASMEDQNHLPSVYHQKTLDSGISDIQKVPKKNVTTKRKQAASKKKGKTSTKRKSTSPKSARLDDQGQVVSLDAGFEPMVPAVPSSSRSNLANHLLPTRSDQLTPKGQSDSNPLVKSKVILQPTRIKNMVSISV